MEHITTSELADRGGATPLIDVREKDEYEAGHVPWAVNVPLSEIESRVAEIPTDGEVTLICKSGGRSSRTGAWLESRGRDVINVDGGTDAWVAEGREVLTGAERATS